jgi:hypothetical protein
MQFDWASLSAIGRRASVRVDRPSFKVMASMTRPFPTSCGNEGPNAKANEDAGGES